MARPHDRRLPSRFESALLILSLAEPALPGRLLREARRSLARYGIRPTGRSRSRQLTLVARLACQRTARPKPAGPLISTRADETRRDR